MQSFKYSAESLIEEVKVRRSLWDNNHVQHRNQVRRTQLWKAIALTFTKGTPKSKSEIFEIARELQKKWKGIRDAYFKYLNRPNRRKRPYIYADILGFLDGIKSVNRQSVPSVPSYSDSDEDTSEMKPCAEDMVSSESETENVVKEAPPSPILFEFTDKDLPGASNAPESEDSDRLFLLSLLPHLKSIPTENRLNVKVEIMHLIQNANQQLY